MSYFPLVLLAVLIVAFVLLLHSVFLLSRKHKELDLATQQMLTYGLLCEKGTSERTKEQLALSQTIYHNVVKEYNSCISKPTNRPVAYLLGYDPVSDRPNALP
ncbi:MAG: hypothetical protein RR053_04735 [Evtepia sp.]